MRKKAKVGEIWLAFIRIEVPIKIEEKQLIKKIGSINKYDMYIYLNELSDFFLIMIL